MRIFRPTFIVFAIALVLCLGNAMNRKYESYPNSIQINLQDFSLFKDSSLRFDCFVDNRQFKLAGSYKFDKTLMRANDGKHHVWICERGTRNWHRWEIRTEHAHSYVLNFDYFSPVNDSIYTKYQLAHSGDSASYKVPAYYSGRPFFEMRFYDRKYLRTF